MEQVANGKSELRALLSDNSNDVDSYYNGVHAAAAGRPAFWDHGLKAWIVCSHLECEKLMKSTSLIRTGVELGTPSTEELGRVIGPIEELLNMQMIFRNDALASKSRQFWRTSLRSSAEPAQNALSLSDLASLTISECDRDGHCNLYASLLRTYVSRVISAKLGIPEPLRSDIYPAIQRYVSLFDGKEATNADLVDWLRGIGFLYKNILSGSVNWAEYRGHDEPLIQSASNYILVLVAGHESTAFLLGTIFRESRQYGGLLSMLKKYRSDFTPLIHESIRYDAPVQLVSRIANEALDLGGLDIKRGERVYLHLGAANRDPDIYSAASNFDPDRRSAGHLGFGLGNSRCIAAGVVLEQSKAILGALLRECTEIEIHYDRISLDSGLSGREYSEIPGKIMTAAQGA